MQLQISHSTRYDYDAPVNYALQKVRLRPMETAQQTVDRWDIAVEGGQVEVEYVDHFGNLTALVSADPGTQGVALTAQGTVSVTGSNGVFGRVYGAAPLWLFLHQTPMTEPGETIRKLSEPLTRADDKLSALHDLSAAIVDKAPYSVGATTAATTAEQALEIGNGVCQDHAQIFISACREAGIPARYISGYLMMNDRIEQDASHAWAEAHLDDLGWVGFDVSNGYSPDERYVRLAAALDTRGAAPVSGLRLGSASEEMHVTLQVQQQ